MTSRESEVTLKPKFQICRIAMCFEVGIWNLSPILISFYHLSKENCQKQYWPID